MEVDVLNRRIQEFNNSPFAKTPDCEHCLNLNTSPIKCRNRVGELFNNLYLLRINRKVSC